MSENITPEEIEARRSKVRVCVTYWAAIFLFLGGALMVGYLLIAEKHEEAKGIFLTILPVSAAIVSYWFAGRSSSQAEPGNGSVTMPKNTEDAS